jgi:glycosyltransferase involved in cell wall biosynthesis
MKKGVKKILMLLENCFPQDVRPRNEAASLIKAGYKVSVISIRMKGQKIKEQVDGVHVYRIPQLTLFKKTYRVNPSKLQNILNNLKSRIGYFYEYFYFTSACMLVSLYILITRGFDVIHAHNPPDTLFIVGGFYKLLGKKFVFDHHDLSPELYMTKFRGKKDLLHKILLSSERFSCTLADVVISSNNSYKEIVTNRHLLDCSKVFVVRNDPVINSRPQRRRESSIDISDEKKKKVLLYVGIINPQDGMDILLKALHYLVTTLDEKNFICNIVGDGDALPLMKQLASELNLTEYVDFKGFIFDRNRIREYLQLSDVCLEPAPYNEINKHSTFIKIMEYMGAGKPIVAFDLKETRYSADGAAMLINPGGIKGFAEAIKKLLDNLSLREKLGRAGLERIKNKLNWENTSLNLVEAYRTLYP